MSEEKLVKEIAVLEAKKAEIVKPEEPTPEPKPVVKTIPKPKPKAKKIIKPKIEEKPPLPEITVTSSGFIKRVSCCFNCTNYKAGECIKWEGTIEPDLMCYKYTKNKTRHKVVKTKR